MFCSKGLLTNHRQRYVLSYKTALGIAVVYSGRLAVVLASASLPTYLYTILIILIVKAHTVYTDSEDT